MRPFGTFPSVDRFEFPLQKTLAAGTSLDLPAGSFGNRARMQHFYRNHLYIECREDGSTDGLYGFAHSHIVVMAHNLLCYNQLLATRSFDPKHCATTWAEQRVALLYDLLDILRVEIATTNDDEILESTRDIKLLFETKTEIS